MAATEDLAAAARRAAAAVAKLGRQLRSAPPPPAAAVGLRVAFHTHSLDLTADGGGAAADLAPTPLGEGVKGRRASGGSSEGAAKETGSAGSKVSSKTRGPPNKKRRLGEVGQAGNKVEAGGGADEAGAQQPKAGAAAFVKLTREAYGRLAELHRRHGPPAEAAPAPTCQGPGAEAEVQPQSLAYQTVRRGFQA